MGAVIGTQLNLHIDALFQKNWEFKFEKANCTDLLLQDHKNSSREIRVYLIGRTYYRDP
jgi:hypothetical protein